MATKNKHLLMCPPTYFQIDYEINPWMKIDNQVDQAIAQKQWQELYDLYTEKLNWQVDLLKAKPNLPDLVFTANGGLIINNKAFVASFRHPQRQPETSHFQDWFLKKCDEVETSYYNFEGEGDALIWQDYIFAGYPWRTTKSAHPLLGKYFDKQVVSLHLIDDRFYHLDICLTPIDDQTVALYTPAFMPQSVEMIEKIVPNIIKVSQSDALAYGLNAISDGQNIVLPKEASGLAKIYSQLGLKVWPIDISEFKKSGGGVKCLTLEIH